MRVSRTAYRFPFARYPALRLVLLFIVGILLAQLQLVGWVGAMGISVALLAGAALAEWRLQQSASVAAAEAAAALYLLLVISLGLMASSIQRSAASEQRSEYLLTAHFDGEALRWYGRVDDARRSATQTVSVFMRVDSVYTSEGDKILAKPFNTQIRFFRADRLTFKDLVPGAYVALMAEPSVIPFQRNPHDFNVQGWLNSLGVYVQATGISLEQVMASPTWRQWGWWRANMREGINRVFAPEQAPLAQAILIGYRGELQPEMRLDFSRAGLAHLMAVSGMHVGFVLIPIWFILPYFWRMRYGGAAGLLLITVVLFLYAGITGFSPSVQRASVFAFFIAIARLYRYQSDPLNLTGLAALVILVIDPSSLYQIGFQMSFAAVITIFIMLPVLERMFSNRHRFRWYARIIQLTILSVCIQLALMPILIHRFNEYSLIGPIMNTIAAPMAQLMFIMGFLGVFVGMLHESLGILLTAPASWLTGILAWLTTHSAALPGAYVSGRLPSMWVYPFWAALFASVACMFNAALRFRIIILCGLFALGWQGEVLLQKYQHKPVLELTFFDVGQGAAVLIQTAQGKNYLYDTGLWTPFGNSGDRFILPHLRQEGISRLHGIFLSHPHADHIGGVLPILHEIEVDIIYDSGFEYGSALFAGYRVAARELGVPVQIPSAGETIWLDEVTPALVLGPLPQLNSSNPNEHSLVIQILYGNQRVLLTGDAETQAERLLVQQYGRRLQSDIYKAGHHGSRTSSHEFFLNKIQPRKTVVTNGLNNRYNHPHPEAAWRMLHHTHKERLFYTALEGAIILRLNGDDIERVSWR